MIYKDFFSIEYHSIWRIRSNCFIPDGFERTIDKPIIGVNRDYVFSSCYGKARIASAAKSAICLMHNFDA